MNDPIIKLSPESLPIDSAPQAISVLQSLSLAADHLEKLRAGGLKDETIMAAGIKTVEFHQLHQLGFGPECGRAIAFPYPGTSYIRLRLDHPRGDAKYIGPTGVTNRIYVPSLVASLPDDQALFITEGEKKALVATQNGFPAIGLSGVWGFSMKKSPEGVIPDFDQIKWRRREVTVVFDSDLAENPHVLKAALVLDGVLRQRQADVSWVLLPSSADGNKVGLDDFLNRPDGLAAFKVLAEGRMSLAEMAVSMIGVIPERQLEEMTGIVYEIVEASPLRRKALQEELIRVLDKRGMRIGVSDLKKLKKLGSERRNSEDQADDVSFKALAQRFLDVNGFNEQKQRTLWYLDRQYYEFKENRFVLLGEPDLQLRVVRYLQSESDVNVTRSLLGNVMTNLAALCVLDGTLDPPFDIPSKQPMTNWIFCRNGAYHWPSGTSRPITPDIFVHQVIGCDMVWNAPVPQQWLAFLNQVMLGDANLVARIQEWFGLHLDPTVPAEAMAFFLGGGSNGKSVIFHVLMEMVGKENTTSIPPTRMGEKFLAFQLVGKLANIVTEVDAETRWPESTLRQLVSRESIMVEDKFRSAFPFVPVARHTFSGNKFPKFREITYGNQRRFLLIPCRYNVPKHEERAMLKHEIVAKELPGILLWALEGLKRFCRNNGKFTPSPEADEDLDSSMSSLGPLSEFIADCCVLGPNYYMDKHTLHRTYNQYASLHSNLPIDYSLFCRQIPDSAAGISQYRPTINGVRVQCFRGISLRNSCLQIQPVSNPTVPPT